MKKFRRFISIIITIVMLFNINVIAISESSLSNDSAVTENFYTESTQYAIYTENYFISYKIGEEGQIIMDKSALDDLISLSKDKNTLQKIVNNKNSVNYSNLNNVASTDTASEISNNLQNVEYKLVNDDTVVIDDAESVQAVRAASNFASDVYKEEQTTVNGGIEIVVNYLWSWDYTPVYTLTDIVSMTWNDGMDSSGSDVNFMYMRSGYRRITNSDGTYTYDTEDTDYLITTQEGDDAYTDSTAGVGFQKSYDIKRTFTKNGKTYHVNSHSGAMQIKLKTGKLTSSDDGIVSVVGDYFHQTVKPDTTLTLTTDGAEMGLLARARYDHVDNCARTINYL